MMDKFRFYERYGVEEYYVFDPDKVELDGWIRQGDQLVPIENTNGWQSPRLGVRFDLSSGDLKVVRPDGQPFATYVELAEQNDRERQRAERTPASRQERQRADEER